VFPVNVGFLIWLRVHEASSASWRKLKQRLIEEGSEVVTNCHGFKLKTTYGEM